MKKIINGKMYDTETSEEIYIDEMNNRRIFQTKKGNYFLLYPNGELVPKTEDEINEITNNDEKEELEKARKQEEQEKNEKEKMEKEHEQQENDEQKDQEKKEKEEKELVKEDSHY